MLQLAVAVPLIDKSAEIRISDSLLISLLGFSLVFAVLIVLIAVIKLITAAANAAKRAAMPTAESVPTKPNVGKVLAAGSLGEIDLHSVEDQTAAMVMAIVADELKTPLNELRFTSIKEVGEK